MLFSKQSSKYHQKNAQYENTKTITETNSGAQ